VPLRRFFAVLASLLVGIATLVAVPTQAHAAPNFKAPFPCNQRWTYDHHSTEVRRALDFIRADGGTTNGTPVLASAGGVATRYSQPTGAGNYIVIDHGGGWTTYYFHLSAYSVASGASVAQGQQIGLTGTTGNSSGPHIHYEQLLNGVGQDIVINGSALAYPSSYNQYYLTSDNACGGTGGAFMTWGSGVNVRSDARLNAPVVTTLPGPTSVWVTCQKQGDTVTAEGYTNNWWSKLRDQGGFVSNIYIDHPDPQLPGVPIC
jgi:Peptidase family M23